MGRRKTHSESGYLTDKEMEDIISELGGSHIISTTVVNHKRKSDCYSEEEYELEMERFDASSPREKEDWMITDCESD